MDDQTIYGSFAHMVRQHPGHAAVIDDRETLSYVQLNQRACSIARSLPRQADSIGVVCAHENDLIASILAVLKTGAAYVPAEPDFPIERIRFMMRESDVDLIVTQRRFAEWLQGFDLLFLEDIAKGDTEGDLTCEASPDMPAYVLYTSGSTGVPKGVVVTNANVCHYVRAFQHEFAPTSDDTTLQQSVCTFDIFVEEVFCTLLSGATLAIAPAQTRHDVRATMDFVEAHGITIMSGFPYQLIDMNRLDHVPASLRLLISGGDVLRASYVDRLLPQVTVYNTYGPSETTVCATYFRCNGSSPLEDGTYPIGKPVPGTRIQLLDEDLEPVPRGEAGEICISGGGVSLGYLDKGKNDGLFLELPDGGRLYRSGDLGRMLPDGNIAFLQRKDQQVMILGRRVEPEGVTNVLNRCDSVQQGIVRAGTDECGLAYLTAYVVPASDDFTLSGLRKEMERHLPHYMIPEFFVRMREIPLNENGKPDLEALPRVLKEGGRR
jgi:D-alanine--poly(phosphoribitol) ligase subunit 1